RRYTHFRGTFSSEDTSSTLRRRLTASPRVRDSWASAEPRPTWWSLGEVERCSVSCGLPFQLASVLLSASNSVVVLPVFSSIYYSPCSYSLWPKRSPRPFAAAS